MATRLEPEFVVLSEDELLKAIAELNRIRTKINTLLDQATSAMVLAPSRREPIEKPKKKVLKPPLQGLLPSCDTEVTK